MVQLGKKIRTERRRVGLSLKDLAARVGVSIMALQRIEVGKVAPSVSVVVKIAHQLNRPLSDLIPDPPPSIRHVKAANLRPATGFDGVEATVLARPGLWGEETAVDLVRLEPNQPRPRRHRHEINGYFVIDGQVSLEYNGRYRRLGRGDVVRFDASYPHRFQATGSARLLRLSAPR